MSCKAALVTLTVFSLLLSVLADPTLQITTPSADSRVDPSSSLLVSGIATDAVLIEITLHNDNSSDTLSTTANVSGVWEVLFDSSNVTTGPKTVTAVAYSASGVFVRSTHGFFYDFDSVEVNPKPVDEAVVQATASHSPSPVRPLPPLAPGSQAPSIFSPSSSVSPMPWTQPAWTPDRGWDGQTIPVVIDGETMCYLRVPNVVLAQRDLDYRAFLRSEDPRQGDITLYVDLYDEKQRSIHQLERPMTICIRQTGDMKDVECLGYFSEVSGEWECQDKELVFDEVADMLCGKTDHLTQFSLLLTGGAASSSDQYVIAWVSLGFAGGAVLFFLAGALVVELIRLKETIHRRSVLAEISSQMGQYTTASL